MTLSLGSYIPADPLLTASEAQAACAQMGGGWVDPGQLPPLGGCAVGDPLPVVPTPGGGGACGADPCSAWDQVWVRDGCLSFLRCANPTDPRVIAMDQGFFTGAGAAVGGAASGTLRGVLGGLFQNQDGSLNMVTLAAVGIGAYVLLKGK